MKIIHQRKAYEETFSLGCLQRPTQAESTIRMGNSPSTGHGSEEAHVANMEARNLGERPIEEQSRKCVETKSDSNEDPMQKPPQYGHCYKSKTRYISSREFINYWQIIKPVVNLQV